MADARSERLGGPAGPAVDLLGFEGFVVEHYDRLVGLAGLVGGDVAAAEDVVQTALERGWRARRSLRGEASLRPWLDRIVVRALACSWHLPRHAR